MIVVHDYHGYRIEVEAVSVDGRFHADVRLRRILTSEKPSRETVSRYELTAEHAEWAGELWAKR